MSGFNPFMAQAPNQGPAGAPPMQGVQAPNAQMQDKPGMVESFAPMLAGKAMESKAGKEIMGKMFSPLTDAFGVTGQAAATGAATAAPSIAAAAPAVSQALLPGVASGALHTAAAAAPAAASAAIPAAGKGAAALLGPIGIPLAMLAMSQ